MLFLPRVLPALMVALRLVQASTLTLRNQVNQDPFFSGFIAALRENNLTILANNYERISETEEGQNVIDLLKFGELTILAPKDRAFDPEHSDVSASVLRYSTLWGSIDKDFKIPKFSPKAPEPGSQPPSESHKDPNSQQPLFPSQSSQAIPQPTPTGSVARKRENDKPAEKFQVQVIDQISAGVDHSHGSNPQSILIGRAVGDAEVVDRFTFQKIIILIIDTVLTLPAKASELLCKPLIANAPDGFTKFAEGLKKTGLLNLLDTKKELTAFIPTDDFFGDLRSLSKGELASLLKNHFFFGQRVFAPKFVSVCKATAASGKQLKFSFENGMHYVSCGKTQALLLRRDVISANGVMHVIDRPLKCD